MFSRLPLRHLPLHRRAALAVALSLTAATAAAPALAVSAGCSSLPSKADNLGFYATDWRHFFSTAQFEEGDVITLEISGGEDTTTGGGYFSFYVGNSALISKDYTTGSFTRTLTIPAVDRPGLQVEGMNYRFASIFAICGLPPVDHSAPSAAAMQGLAAQQTAVSTGLAAALRDRFDGAPMATVSRNTFAFSTGADGDALNVWGMATLRGFSAEDDAGDGRQADLVFGVDRMLTDRLVAGLFATHGRGTFGADDAATDGTRTDVTSTVGGLYAGLRFGPALTLDGYAGAGRARYDAGDATFDADRRIAGLSLTGSRDMAAGTLAPFVSARVARDDLPAVSTSATAFAAQRIETRTASLGARFDFAAPLPGTGLRPWVSGGIDHGRLDLGDGGTDRFTAPRLGLGLSGPAGPGDLRIEVDAGKVASDTRDAGLTVSWSLAF